MSLKCKNKAKRYYKYKHFTLPLLYISEKLIEKVLKTDDYMIREVNNVIHIFKKCQIKDNIAYVYKVGEFRLRRPVPDGNALIRIDCYTRKQRRNPKKRFLLNIVYRRARNGTMYNDTSGEVPHPQGSVGVDIGLNNYAAISDGTVFRVGNAIKKTEKRIALIKKYLRRAKKHTKNYNKLSCLLKELRRKRYNQRKQVYMILRKYLLQFKNIVIENFTKIVNMKLGNKVINYGLKRIIKKLEEDLKYRGRNVILLKSKKFSSICYKCKSRLYQFYKETCCGIHRDINAAINALEYAVKHELIPDLTLWYKTKIKKEYMIDKNEIPKLNLVVV